MYVGINASQMFNAVVAAVSTPVITVTKNAKVFPLVSSTPNVPVPGVPLIGDLIFMVVGVTGRTPVTWPAGFTNLEDFGPIGSDHMAFAVRTADGTESGTFTATLTGGSGDWIALGILVHADNATLTVESHGSAFVGDVAGGVAEGAVIPLESPNGVVTAGPNRLILWLTSISSGGENGDRNIFIMPSGFVENDHFEDSIYEFVSCASKVISLPTTADYDGSVTFSSTTHDGAHLVSFNGIVVIAGGGPPAPTPMGFVGTLPGGVVGTPYSADLTITGSFVSPLTLDYAAGSLPAWETATVNESLHKVTFSGTPTTAETETFTPRLTDSTPGTPQVASAPGQSVIIATGGGGGGIVQHDFVEVASGGPTITLTPAAPFTSGNGVVVFASNYLDSGTNGRIASMTCNGVAMTKAVEHNDAVFSESIWYGVAGGGSAGVVATLEASSTQFYLAGWVERDDFDTSSGAASMIDTTNFNTGNSTTPSVTIASIAQANEFICTVFGGENNINDTITVPVDYVQLYLESDGGAQVPCAAAYKTVSATGAQTANYTFASAHAWQLIMAAFKLT